MLSLSTKGKTLKELSGNIKSAEVLPVFIFSVTEFKGDKDKIASGIQSHFQQKLLIIRSSANNEDGFDISNAGHFKTILNVPRNDSVRIIDSIAEVINSYDNPNEDNEVLVQPMLIDIKVSGVIFTADIDTLAPYYIVNYDESGKSYTVTSGMEGNTKTYIRFKEAHNAFPNRHLAKACEMCKELEEIFDNTNLDIEFAFDVKEKLSILQVRPIAVKNKEEMSSVNLKDSLGKMYKKVQMLSSAHPNLLGNRAMFGVMPDWNPAEIIGLKPKQLALSLYKELVTDNIWAYQRDNYGYRNLRSHPLMISFLGIPYIDVRVDFNSFIPKSLNEGIAMKLVDYYLKRLDLSPSHHDKIEFEVIHSCYYLSLTDKLKELLNHGFNENEIKRIEYALLDLTNKIIDPEHGLYRQDLKRIKTLEDKYKSIVDSTLPLIDKIYWLTEDCKRYGTLPFAGIARAAFIGVQFLRSFVDLKIISKTEYEGFMASLNTVAKKLNKGSCMLANKEMTKEEFLFEYGHIRPNTYDILSLRYDENFDQYFPTLNSDYPETIAFTFTEEQIEKINIALMENVLKTDASKLIKFIKDAIECREYSKFLFTKSLSKILQLIEELGKGSGISRDDLAYLDIRTVLNLYSTLNHMDVKDILISDIEKNKEFYKYTKAVRLPSLIRDANDVYSFFVESEEPNFITLKRVEGQCIKDAEFNGGSFENKIAIIKSADPGYDFLFTRKIAGLITQFGGANSHMAIRCAELGIPAVIGAGERNFNKWSRAKVLEVDCANRQVRIIS